MRTYVAVTGVIFAVLLIAHAWRAMAEHMVLQANPVFVGTTVMAGVLAAWAIVLLIRVR